MFAILSFGKLYSFSGTLAALRKRRKPSSDGSRKSKLLPA